MHERLRGDAQEERAVPLYPTIMMTGKNLQTSKPHMIQLLDNNSDDDDLLMALNLLVAKSYTDQPWMVKELYQAFTDPGFHHAERLKLFELRRDNTISATGIDRSDITDRATILVAFRDFDRAFMAPDGLSFSTSSFFEGISKAQKRRIIVATGLPPFWLEQGFPPR